MDIREGLEVDGEPVASHHADSDAAFNAVLERAIGKEPEAAKEPARTYHPETDSPQAIQAAVLSPETGGVSVAEGLTVAQEKASDGTLKPEHQKLVDESRHRDAQAASRLDAELNELAYRRAIDYLGDPELLDPDDLDADQLLALVQLRNESPEAYTALIQHLDEAAIDESAYYNPDGDLDEDFPEGLPGARLHQLAELANAELDLAVADEKMAMLIEHIEGQKAEAIEAVYEKQGVHVAQMDAQFEVDAMILAELGFDVEGMTPAELKSGLEVVKALQDEIASEDRKTAFRAELFNAPSTNVRDNFEVLGPLGFVSATPQPSPYSNVSRDDLTARVVARAKATNDPPSNEDIRRAILEPEPTKFAYTGPDGKPIKPEDATGERKRAKRRQEDERARALEGLPVRTVRR